MGARGQVVKAMVLIRRPRDGALLVSEGESPSGESFHRPLGGHVEIGEYAVDTVHRELQEEIGQGLTAVQLAGVLENIFQWDGTTQHEIVFIFTAAFADDAA
jgi:ADP-ribose pyrophosphatase YjhB (NUDIX family)